MTILDKARLLQTSILAGLMVSLAAPAYAQVDDADDFELEEDLITDDEFGDETDEIVATGSRIRRDGFNSISPLQVITADTVIDAGLTSTADIVKSQTVISGVQLDTNINSSFVTNGGPGASNVSLRGLGEDRTLILVNGRRLAPAGVEGAPSLPDLNLVPSSLIARVDTLLDGASSIYGSDAIAGVVNLILREEFDGFRIDGSVTHPLETGGGSRRLTALMGDTGSKGNFIAAVEYRVQDELDFKDRDWQRADNGQYCSFDYEFNSDTGEEFRNCGGAIGSAEFRTFTSPFGTGPEVLPGFFAVQNSRDPNFRSGSLEAFDNILNEQEALTAYVKANRQVNPLGLNDTNAFFEASIANSQVYARNGFHGQLFPSVPASNPFNPLGAAFGAAAVPVVFSPIKRSDIDVDILQYRMVAGIEGEVSGLDDWTYETYASYSRSIGDSVRPVVLEDRLALSLATTRTLANGDIVCGNDLVDLFGFITQETCVPVNLFAPSLYDGSNPQFATQAERDYLEGVRSVTTKVDQLNLSGFFTGPIFKLPGGDAQLVVGGEYRVDGLNSGVDTVASTGGAAGFFADATSIGQVWQAEGFAELELPLIKGQPLAESLTLNLSGRVVDNEFYDTETVYAIKGQYSPTDWLTFAGTYGTSYRSPGVRELFLGGQTSFGGGRTDRCVIPILAPGEEDTREQVFPFLFQNCFAAGVDPTTLGSDGVPSIEVIRRGNLQLDPETSDAFTASVTFEQPFTDAFDLLFKATYFDVSIDDASSEPGAQFIFDQCYLSPNFPNEPECDLVRRDPVTGFLSEVDNTPFNVATFGAKGVDINLRGVYEFDLGDRAFTLINDTVITNQFSRESQSRADSPLLQAAGDIGFPELRGTFNTRLQSGAWSFFWGARYIGKQDDFNQASETDNPSTADGRFAATGGRTPADTRFQHLDDYWRHDMSVRYNAGDDWSLVVGINNVFDRDPPILDQDAGATLIGNFPAGIGYDARGRSLFMTASKTF